MNDDPIEMLETVARGLGDGLADVVFVGGAIASLYMDDPGARVIRMTDDVDFVIEIVNLQKYYGYQSRLRSRGFVDDLNPNTASPICRMIFDGVPVDVMTPDESILGFSNRWYREIFTNRITRRLPTGVEIFIPTLPFFIATKLEAFRGRSEPDSRISHDIEDILLVLDGIRDPTILHQAPSELRAYLILEFQGLMADRSFQEGLGVHLESDGRAHRLLQFLKDFVA